MADSCIIGKIAQVKQLPGSTGAQGYKSLEKVQVFYIYKLPQIPLNICLKIITICLARWNILIIYPGVKAFEYYFIDGFNFIFFKLFTSS